MAAVARAEQQRQMSKLDASADALQAEEKERRALISAARKRREAEAEEPAALSLVASRISSTIPRKPVELRSTPACSARKTR